MCFKPKPTPYVFAGNPTFDLVAGLIASNQVTGVPKTKREKNERKIAAAKRISLVAEPPYEIVFVKNGAIEDVYKTQRITHTRAKTDIYKYIFVNMTLPAKTGWGTRELLTYKDFKTGQVVEVGAGGTISMHIADSKVFIEKVLGTRLRYNIEDLKREMIDKIMDEFNDHLLSVIDSERISYDMFDSAMRSVAKLLLPKLNSSIEKYGIHVEEFIITEFMKPTELRRRIDKSSAQTEELDDTEHRIRLAEREAVLKKTRAKGDIDVEQMDRESKGATYKELREEDRKDIRAIADSEAKIREATKMPELTVSITKGGQTGICQHCDAVITEGQIFCPVCRRKI